MPAVAGASQRCQLSGVPLAATSEPAQIPTMSAVGNRLVSVLLKPSSATPRLLISSSVSEEMP